MLHHQGAIKNNEAQPDEKQNNKAPNEADKDPNKANKEPNEESKIPVATMEAEEYVVTPPWEAPPKLPSGVDWPTEGKAKGKTHPQQVPQWVTKSRALLSRPYGVMDCREKGCTNPGRAWSKGPYQMEYYCDVHRLLLQKKWREQSKLNRAKH